MISSRGRSFVSAGVNAHFSTCSLQRLTKSSSDSRGSWRYTINFSRAVRKFSAGSSPKPVQDCCWCLLGFRHGPGIEAPESFFPHLEKNVCSLFSFWNLLHCEMQLQCVGEKFKAFCVVVCGPVHLRCLSHVERLSVWLLPLQQELWLFLCSLSLTNLV